MAMRVDTKPFDDIRVRRALNMAVNKQEIVIGLLQRQRRAVRLSACIPTTRAITSRSRRCRQSVKELFEYNPDKAKKLLAEAGYPNGFTFKVQVCACSPDHMDLLPLVAAYLEKVGVKIEIQPMEYAAFLSAMTSRKMTPGYFMNNGHTNPTTTIRKSFMTGQQWNPSGWSRSRLRQEDGRGVSPSATRASARRCSSEMTREILDKAPYIWLPTPYIYTAWWPWVKNYNGELRAGAVRPGPIYARIWMDQELKKKMGY